MDWLFTADGYFFFMLLLGAIGGTLTGLVVLEIEMAKRK